MKSIIYYFTGTGNSMHVARRIAAEVDDSRVAPISGRRSHYREPAEVDRHELDVLGFVSPVHFQGIPMPVRNLIRGLGGSKARFVFFVVAHRGGPGHAMADAARLLKKSGMTLDYVRDIRMPDNYCAMVKECSYPLQTGCMGKCGDSIRPPIAVLAGHVPEYARRLPSA